MDSSPGQRLRWHLTSFAVRPNPALKPTEGAVRESNAFPPTSWEADFGGRAHKNEVVVAALGAVENSWFIVGGSLPSRYAAPKGGEP